MCVYHVSAVQSCVRWTTHDTNTSSQTYINSLLKRFRFGNLQPAVCCTLCEIVIFQFNFPCDLLWCRCRLCDCGGSIHSYLFIDIVATTILIFWIWKRAKWKTLYWKDEQSDMLSGLCWKPAHQILPYERYDLWRRSAKAILMDYYILVWGFISIKSKSCIRNKVQKSKCASQVMLVLVLETRFMIQGVQHEKGMQRLAFVFGISNLIFLSYATPCIKCMSRNNSKIPSVRGIRSGSSRSSFIAHWWPLPFNDQIKNV